MRRALRWFRWTYEVQTTFGSARWTRVSWPRGTATAAEQDAWLTEALEYLARVHTTMLREAMTRHKKARTT